MAVRYWVGGAGNWSSTTKWSTTSGGASGASVPISTDDVVFDANSGGKFTATVDTAQTCASLSITPSAGAGVLQIAITASLTVTGAVTTSGTAGNNRIWLRGTTYGIATNFICNGTVTISDCDFRDLYVTGTAAPISGTRIGDLRGVRGVTTSAPKTVYWNLAAGGNWSATAWAASSGGAVSTDNHPLAQDTAIIENTGLNTSATVTLDAAVPYIGTINMSTRTNAMTLNTGGGTIVSYGNWTNGSGTTLAGGALTFSGRNTQTITSAGKAFPGSITVDSYGGSVELADALTITSSFVLAVTNGGFDSKGFNVTAGQLSSSNSNVRSITLGASTVTLINATNPVLLTTSDNLTLSAGTSQITMSATSASTFAGGGLTFYNVSFTGTTAITNTISGVNTFNNLTITASAATGVMQLAISANQTINGTLTVAGATAIRRCFVRSDTLGTPRTLTVATLAATDCDFRDITIAGAAAGSSPTRAGDCGGNTGITFPSPKTVYWNLAGTQNWSATGWATSSGGTPAVNNFPLAQDTAIFDNTGTAGTVTIDQAWNIGTVDFSARTSAMTLTAGNSSIYGDWKWGTGVTSTSNATTLTFAKRGTQTITSNGVQFGCNITVFPSLSATTETVQLADALSLASTRTLTLTGGTFDAVTFNVTTGLVDLGTSGTRTLKMGSGTWTLTGTGTVWTVGAGLTFYKGTANITLSDTSTTARTFAGGGFSYNKLTIGGTTGTSTLTITGNNQFTELASTKTVAHTIALGTTTQTFGKWTVTGTVGNVVTLTGTGTSHVLAGACTTGIDYLVMGSIGFAATSPGEFYAGANSTGTAGAPVYRTAKPADSTRYWVGGTGNWSDTARWSTGSGGASGASVPRSHDDVVFDSASNATAYTATVNAVTGGIRVKSLTIAGPASGNLTLAGSTAIDGIHGSVTLPATGLTRTYTGGITLTSNSTGLTFTTNGVSLASNIAVNGVDCSWSLGSALTNTNPLFLVNGEYNTAGYTVSGGSNGVYISIHSENSITLSLGSSLYTLNNSNPILATPNLFVKNFTFNTGTSTIIFTGNAQAGFNVGTTLITSPLTFNNLDVGTALTSTGSGGTFFGGGATFNNLRFFGRSGSGISQISLPANVTVTGTLTVVAGTDATCREFITSNTLGTTRTITAAAVSLTDVDFRDITIAGAAAPAGGTRIGDCKGNSGITFTAAANKYWNLAAGGNWGGAIAWATSSGGTPAINNFPLAQDTAFIENTGLNASATVTINAAYNIGTLNMSSRTTAMTLTTSAAPVVYGNWVNGTGVTPSGTNQITFSGRTSQTLTNAGRTFTQGITVDSPSGTVTLQDAFITNRTATGALTVTNGTFDAATYNVTLSGAAATFSSNNSNTRTIAVGSGTWTLAGSGTAWDTTTSTGLTVTGTGTVTMTSGSSKTFSGGGAAYTNITLDQGGAGQLTISGNNTFKDITNSYKGTGAATIALAATTQRVSQWTGAGEAARLLTLSGTSAASPATLILTGVTKPNVDYLSISNVRAYSLDTTWYAGANSTNGGSLGWYFESGAVSVSTGNFFFFLKW